MQKTVHDFAYAHRHQIASKVDLHATDQGGIGEGYILFLHQFHQNRKVTQEFVLQTESKAK